MPTTSFTPAVLSALREALPEVADQAVTTIVAEVPSYADAFAGPMGDSIRTAVQIALGGFLTLATREDATTPPAAAMDGAYRLGRGEARHGRTVEALLAAYRIGARVAWRDMSREAVAAGADAALLSRFAELVFAYIDELSAASVAGHADELSSSGRLRQRNLERLARALVSGAEPEAVVAAAERADWQPAASLTAVLLPDSQVAHLATILSPATLVLGEDMAGVPEDRTVVLVPSTGSTSARRTLVRGLRDTAAVVGPTVPWLEASRSFARALRALPLVDGRALVDADQHLAALLLAADDDVRRDLRAQVLEPLAGVRPSSAEKLTETLRAWVLHQGRRDAMASALFVHPQTVRYRVGQLREVYGDRLEDPFFVRDATLALG